jgi:hypothetical protein
MKCAMWSWGGNQQSHILGWLLTSTFLNPQSCLFWVSLRPPRRWSGVRSGVSSGVNHQFSPLIYYYYYFRFHCPFNYVKSLEILESNHRNCPSHSRNIISIKLNNLSFSFICFYFPFFIILISPIIIFIFLVQPHKGLMIIFHDFAFSFVCFSRIIIRN